MFVDFQSHKYRRRSFFIFYFNVSDYIKNDIILCFLLAFLVFMVFQMFMFMCLLCQQSLPTGDELFHLVPIS